MFTWRDVNYARQLSDQSNLKSKIEFMKNVKKSIIDLSKHRVVGMLDLMIEMEEKNLKEITEKIKDYQDLKEKEEDE